jgi:hypothetical protein
MKKSLYIGLFTLLGVLVSFLVHGILEIAIVRLLLADFSTYSLGLSWAQWFAIHKWGSIILLVLGVVIGFWQGKRWWYVLYETNQAGK